MVELRPHYGESGAKYFVPLHIKRGKEISILLNKQYKNCSYFVNTNIKRNDFKSNEDDEFMYHKYDNYYRESDFSDNEADYFSEYTNEVENDSESSDSSVDYE